MKYLIFFIAFIPCLGQAKIAVTQIKGNRAIVSFEPQDKMHVGMLLKVFGTTVTDQNAMAVVTKIVNNEAMVDFPRSMTLQVGYFLDTNSFEKPDPEENPNYVPGAGGDKSSSGFFGSGDDSWHFAAGGYYVFPVNLSFTGVTATNTVTSYSASLNYSGTFGVELELHKMPRHSLGYIGGVSYDVQSSLSSATVAGFSYGSNSNYNSQIQTTSVFASVDYRWESLYIPVGLSYNFVTFTPAYATFGSATASGGIGGQLGIGYFFTDHISAEASGRINAVTLSSNYFGTTTNYGTGYAETFLVSGKYAF